MAGLLAVLLAAILIIVVAWGAFALLDRANLDERLSDDYEPEHQAPISPRWGAGLATVGAVSVAASTVIRFAGPPGHPSYSHHVIIGTPTGLALLILSVGVVGGAWTAAHTGTGRWATLGLGIAGLFPLARGISQYAVFHEVTSTGSGLDQVYLGPGAWIGLAGLVFTLIGGIVIGVTRPRHRAKPATAA